VLPKLVNNGLAQRNAPGVDMSTQPQVYIEKSPADIAAASARFFADLTRHASPAHPFTVALSGGSTPRLLYDLLSSPPYRDRIPWSSIHFCFGDERWVPHTDPASNFKLANDYLFQPLDLSHTLIYPMPTSGEPEEAAARYEATLRGAFNLQDAQVPTFDLIFLGMGDEGHTASLFPHTAVLHDDTHLVASTYVPKLSANRITLTPLTLCHAAHTLLMVGGSAKAGALHEVLEGDYNPDEYPAQLLRNSTGKVTWLVDTAAASQLQASYPQTW
jgi:6-phosphogluconolactonase